jgi:DNA-binding transcriptional regulator YhcF (GntR family)
MEFAPDEPRWRQVARVIRQRIDDGTYPPRTRVPSVVEMLEEFGIATSTGQKVHRALRAEGLIYTEPGMGSFVTAQPPAESSEDSARNE